MNVLKPRNLVPQRFYRPNEDRVLVNRFPLNTSIGNAREDILKFLKPYSVVNVVIARQDVDSEYQVVLCDLPSYPLAQEALEAFKSKGIEAIFPFSLQIQICNLPAPVTTNMLHDWLDQSPHYFGKEPGIAKVLSHEKDRPTTQAWLQFTSSDAACRAFEEIVERGHPKWNFPTPSWLVVNFEKAVVEVNVPIVERKPSWMNVTMSDFVPTQQVQQPREIKQVKEEVKQEIIHPPPTAQPNQPTVPMVTSDSATTLMDVDKLEWIVKFPKKPEEKIELHWIPTSILIQDKSPHLLVETIPTNAKDRHEALEALQKFEETSKSPGHHRIQHVCSEETLLEMVQGSQTHVFGVWPNPKLEHELMNLYGQGKSCIAVVRPDDISACFVASKTYFLDLDESIADEYQLWMILIS